MIHTFVRVIIPKYTYKYMSTYLRIFLFLMVLIMSLFLCYVLFIKLCEYK